MTIVGLLTSISWDYQQNSFMRQWFTSNASVLGLLLNNYYGTIVVAIAGTLLLAWKIAFRG